MPSDRILFNLMYFMLSTALIALSISFLMGQVEFLGALIVFILLSSGIIMLYILQRKTKLEASKAKDANNI